MRLAHPPQSTHKILLVDSDSGFVAGLRRNLEFEGYEVVHAEDGRAAVERLTRDRPSLVLLELALPDVDGMEVLQRMCGEGCSAPVLVFSERNDEWDRVTALRMGAEDYIAKSCGVLELQERVKKHLPRTGTLGTRARQLQLGNVVVELDTRVVRRGGDARQHRNREAEVTFDAEGVSGLDGPV